MQDAEVDLFQHTNAMMVPLKFKFTKMVPYSPPDSDNPLRQVIIATHSPLLVEHVAKDVLFATEFKLEYGGITTRALHLQPLQGTWRVNGNGVMSVYTEDVKAYLTAPEGNQLKFMFEGLPGEH